MADGFRLHCIAPPHHSQQQGTHQQGTCLKSILLHHSFHTLSITILRVLTHGESTLLNHFNSLWLDINSKSNLQPVVVLVATTAVVAILRFLDA